MAYVDKPIDVPCGQCIGCRLEKSRQWALRCVHEAQLHDENSFITLTYDDDSLPTNASLDVTHFQRFMKRLRKKLGDKKIRFFHCGEYGSNDPSNPKHRLQYGISKLGRPHYHALIFGHEFIEERELIKEKDGTKLYTSPLLQELWPKGFNTVGELTFESAAYCARYITKKINGEAAKDHYTRISHVTGESFEVKPEYITMSRRPGIASDWYDKYKNDVYPKDFTTVRGKKIKPPKFYDRKLEEESIDEYNKIKARRIKQAKANKSDNTPERLATKEYIKKVQAEMLKRNLND